MYALRRPLHQSWILASFFFGITVGVIVSFWLREPYLSLITWPLGSIVVVLIGVWRRYFWLLLPVFLAGGMIGLWRGGIYGQQLAPYSRLTGQVVTVQGKVSEDAAKGDHGEMVLRLNSIEIDNRPLKGSVWVSMAGEHPIKRSDKVTVRGKLGAGFGSFAASMYRAELIGAERPVPGDIALRVRDWFAGAVRQAIPEPEASLGIGYLVGQRRSLPEDLDTALKAAGLTHVVVASGYNLTILVNVSRRLFVKISKFLAAFFSGGMIVAFIAVTGMSPSMSRAGLVAGLGLVAWYYGRKFHPLVLLPFAAAVTLVVQPAYGGGDLGWQLSFASFAGVLIVAPLLQNYFFGLDESGIMRQVLFETLSAWICTVPLIVLVFGQFSNVAILANLLVLPLIPLAMVLTFAAGVASLVVPTLAGLVGFPATLVLGYMTKVTIFLGNVPWAQTTLAIGPFILAAYYFGLVVFCAYVWRKTRFNFVKSAVE